MLVFLRLVIAKFSRSSDMLFLALLPSFQLLLHTVQFATKAGKSLWNDTILLPSPGPLTIYESNCLYYLLQHYSHENEEAHKSGCEANRKCHCYPWERYLNTFSSHNLYGIHNSAAWFYIMFWAALTWHCESMCSVKSTLFGSIECMYSLVCHII